MIFCRRYDTRGGVAHAIETGCTKTNPPTCRQRPQPAVVHVVGAAADVDLVESFVGYGVAGVDGSDDAGAGAHHG